MKLRACKDHLGNEFKSIKDMAAKWHIPYAVLQRRLQSKHFTLEQALLFPVGHGIPARDHEGRDFPSISAMARAWGVSSRVLRLRLMRGWDVKEALTMQNLRNLGRYRKTLERQRATYKS